MTRAISILLILAAPWLLTWALCGFIAWNWDASTWSEGARTGMVFVGISITGYLVLIFPWSTGNDYPT